MDKILAKKRTTILETFGGGGGAGGTPLAVTQDCLVVDMFILEITSCESNDNSQLYLSSETH